MTDPDYERFDFGNDLDYGEFKFKYFSWNDTDYHPFVTVPSRACKPDSDFGIFDESSDATRTDEKDYKFYKAEEWSDPNIIQSFRCIDDPVVLYGNWNTGKTQTLMIEFETCNREERKTCKSEKEIQAFLSNK